MHIYRSKGAVMSYSSSNFHHRFIAVKEWFDDHHLVPGVYQSLYGTEQNTVRPHGHRHILIGVQLLPNQRRV